MPKISILTRLKPGSAPELAPIYFHGFSFFRLFLLGFFIMDIVAFMQGGISQIVSVFQKNIRFDSGILPYCFDNIKAISKINYWHYWLIHDKQKCSIIITHRRDCQEPSHVEKDRSNYHLTSGLWWYRVAQKILITVPPHPTPPLKGFAAVPQHLGYIT